MILLIALFTVCIIELMDTAICGLILIAKFLYIALGPKCPILPY